MAKPQIIYGDNGPAFVVLPIAEYLARFPESTLSDEALFDLAQAQNDGGERTPHDVVKRLIDGENPVKVYREWRAMTQEELALRTKVSSGYVSQIERGARHLSRKTRAIFAQALGVDADDLETE
ncbi:MAG: hypothetical protein A3G18_00525 [Rhodospirillales bacterium RIFCSPLOWO2_12_FULL_58_28]|nr:MAG: hypothetical protein A3H92_05460 [Rhodospirillales bacterium RIFCSPLOWO2_02_FULL_58_16]OHC77034.1 MAG: hypothetical protein A3G18_00525 [Rhodospirillales bacterium RIFCSPLOWO2_12_FULL_58_28]